MTNPASFATTRTKGEYEAALAGAGFEQVSVEFTHEVADGMHGAIVKAVKPVDAGARTDVATRSLRLTASSTSGCCEAALAGADRRSCSETSASTSTSASSSPSYALTAGHLAP